MNGADHGTTPAAALAAALAGMLVLGACSTSGTASGTATRAAADAGTVVEIGGTMQETGARDTAHARGLALTRWFVPADEADRESALAGAVASGLLVPAEAPESGSALVAAGFSLYTADDARLDELKEALGGSPQVRTVLLGSLSDWADIESLPLESGRAVFFAGRPRMQGDSIVRLWLRGWCFPTVDGARARVDARITTEDTRGDRITLDPTLAARPRLRVADGARSAFELPPGQALVILERPIVPPDRAANDPLAVLPPPTYAALLLAERAIPGRATILVVTTAMQDMLPDPAGTGP